MVMRQYTAEYKAKIVLEMLRKEDSVSELYSTQKTFTEKRINKFKVENH